MACISCAKPASIIWEEGATDSTTGKTVHTMRILNPPSGTDWTIWFGQFRTPVTMEEGAPATIQHISGTLYRVIPSAESQGDEMTLRYEARALVNRCRAPEGFYLQKGGGKSVPLTVEYTFLPVEDIHSFSYSKVATSAFDIIPRPKEIVYNEGETDPTKDAEDVSFVEGQVPGWYRITLDGKIKVEAADAEGLIYARTTLGNIRLISRGNKVSNAVITDYPDMQYRGMMLDVSRNFTKTEDLLTLIDMLSHYKVNYLHLHLGDDEGWRLEIKSLPELTSYGAFRGIPTLNADGTISEPDALQPTYCGSLDRNDSASPGNGFYSHKDFIRILRYAADRGIHVIPEFDTPGHSRAAIKAMEKMAQRTGKDTYLLSEKEDKSEYVSVQDYTDNAINVALPSTYAFISEVFDGIIDLYKEAGVPLDAIHIGGDEVPDGAWTESPACKALMEKEGISDISALKDYYIRNVVAIAQEKGVKLAGWQEVAQHLSPETFEALKKNLFFTNLWSVSGSKEELPYQYANQGVGVVLSNATNCYFDMAYNDSKKERGHSWAAFTDERRSFSLLPYDLYKSVRWDDHRVIRDISKASDGKTTLLPEGEKYLLGVQGQLWAETLRSFDHVTYYLFPKALGLFERGWNAHPEWEGTTVADDPLFMKDFNRFFSTVTANEYAYYESLGISYHVN